MEPTPRRKFTLIDAMVLIAATALALVPIHYIYAAVGVFDLPTDSSLDSFLIIMMGVYAILIPLLITLSLALWLLRLRRPRPRFRQVFRQPGMAASTAILLAALLSLVRFCVFLAIMVHSVQAPFLSVSNFAVQADAVLGVGIESRDRPPPCCHRP